MTTAIALYNPAPPPAALAVFSQPKTDAWEYWLPRWIARKAVTTRKVYSDEIKCFLAFIDWMPIGELKTTDLEAYQQHRVNAGDAPGTVARKVATCCSLVSYIHKRDQVLMPRNVGAAVERVKPDNRLADRILSEAEVLRMFDREVNPRNLAMLRVMYGCGVRISELIGLRWKDIVWRETDALVTVLGKGSKTRTVVVYGPAREALKAIAPADVDPEQHVFRSVHGKMTRIYSVQIVRRAAVRAGIKRPVSPHWFRHASATHSLERGAPLPLVSRTLGHSNLATTGRYLHVRPSESMGKFLAV